MEQIKTQHLRAKQVAKEYHCGVSTVWHYAKLGYLTPKKITRGVTVFLRNEVDNFFTGNTQSQNVVT
ncbi:MAG: hypothetical protein PHF52_08670 [Sulfurospirillaceae bacterium]|nr:hypothetical protein [Sulfurospirillaceae bacterium]